MSRSRRWDEVVARRGHDLRATQARPRQPPRRWREGVGEVLRLPMQEGRRGACGRRQSAGMVKEVEVVELTEGNCTDAAACESGAEVVETEGRARQPTSGAEVVPSWS